jgi:hypothetical protein
LLSERCGGGFCGGTDETPHHIDIFLFFVDDSGAFLDGLVAVFTRMGSGQRVQSMVRSRVRHSINPFGDVLFVQNTDS